MRVVFFIFLVAIGLCAGAEDEPINAQLASDAEVVLRARRVAIEGGSKYTWYKVQVIKVFKNESKARFTNELSVAAYSWEDGVPAGEATLYLERYNATNIALWKLVGGDAACGVSHATK